MIIIMITTIIIIMITKIIIIMITMVGRSMGEVDPHLGWLPT